MAIRKREWTSGGQKKAGWIVDYFDNEGTRRQRTFKTKGAARAWWEGEAAPAVRTGTHTARSASVTVQEAGNQWIDTAEKDGLERATTREYRNHLNLHIVPRLGGTKLSDLTPPTVRNFEIWLRDNGRSPAMVRKVLSSFGAILSDAQEAGLVSRNVVKERPKKRRQKGQESRHRHNVEAGADYPTPDEVNAMLAQTEGYGRAIILTAMRTGLRSSELRALRWADVDFEERKIRVRQRADRWNIIGTLKSAAAQRDIPMTAMLANTLREWKVACPASKFDLAFPTGAGNVENHGNLFARVFAPAWVAAGVTVNGKAKYGIHSLRHFFASWLINEKARGGLEVSLKRAQVLLGHSTMMMTADTYGHLLPSKTDEAEEFTAGEQALMA